FHLAHVINSRLVHIISPSGILTVLGRRVAVIHPDGILVRPPGYPRHFDPNKRYLLFGIELLDMILKGRFIVSAYEPEVGAVGLCIRETEIACMEADEHRHISEVFLEFRAFG